MIVTNAELKEILIKTGILDDTKFEELSVLAKNADISIQDLLIEKDIVSDENLGMMLADHIKYPYVNLQKIFIPEEVFHIIPEKIARKHKIIPFERDSNGIKLAMADPTNKDIIQMLEKKTGTNVIVYYSTMRDVLNTLRIYNKELQAEFDELAQISVRPGNSDADVSVAKIVDLIIQHAYEDKTSDIHIEAEEKNSLIRFRIDGILHDVLFLPKILHDQIVARIKVLSRLRTDEHLSPQDGKMRVKLDEEDLDIRVSILPIVDGEKIVMRLLASHDRQFSLVDLGMSETDLAKVHKAFSKSYGMVLSTGPTGSGKTTSIYAILKLLNTREKNITTIEDPVEYKMKGVNQIQVNPKTNLTFAAGLRSILRQDPNIIFVGEIRDSETAGIAVNAALTGHLVLSTLHTNDAATALPRLVDMNVEPYLVASTVNVIIAQRLIRKICEMCKTSNMISREELIKNLPEDIITKHFDNSEQIRIFKGKGCKICHGSGYKGRIGIFEVLEMTERVRHVLTQKQEADALIKIALDEGMTPMLEDGLNKVAKGDTTIEEVLRVTKVESL